MHESKHCSAGGRGEIQGGKDMARAIGVMRHVGRFLLLSLLAGQAAAGEVYKWVDESGHVQFGDAPPPGSKAQAVEMHKAPSPEDVERAKQRFDARLDQARKRVLGSQAPPEATPAAAAPADGKRSPREAPCFAPLADFVQSPAQATFTPITPTPLDAGQGASLEALMRGVEGHWEGRIEDTSCLGNPPLGETRTVILDIEDAAATWHPVDSMLVVDTQVSSHEQESQRLFIKFRVADALYFNTVESASEINLTGNKVELLSLDDNGVAFLTKNRAPGAGTSRPLRTEVRYFESDGSSMTFTELYFRNDQLSGSREWLLVK